MTFLDGKVYHFNTDGRIASMADKNGNTLSFAYSAS